LGRQENGKASPNVSQDQDATLAAPRRRAMTAARDERPIASIRIGRRDRRVPGDVDDLAASIEDIGLINAITVDENGLLLAGGRRLAACKQLGWKNIPVYVVRCAR
jgi:hypothetical protein